MFSFAAQAPAEGGRRAGEGAEVAAMEADFLRSLVETRRMEADFRAAMAQAVGEHPDAQQEGAAGLSSDGAPRGTREGLRRSTLPRTAALVARTGELVAALADARRPRDRPAAGLPGAHVAFLLILGLFSRAAGRLDGCA